MDPAADHSPALVHGAESQWDKGPRRREDDGGIELLRRQFVGTARPNRAQPQRKLLRSRVAWAREREDMTALELCNLGNDVGSGPESVESEALRVARLAQRSIANQSGAKEWRGCAVTERFRQREAIRGVSW